MSDEIDPLIHQPTRLKLIVYLYVVEEADMIFLKRKTGLTWGNISAHAMKLEDAGYLEIEKTIVDKKTRTVLRLTSKGREAYEAYRGAMFDLLEEND
jgi:DNA-binding MarR family transcriptional regulator